MKHHHSVPLCIRSASSDPELLFMPARSSCPSSPTPTPRSLPPRDTRLLSCSARPEFPSGGPVLGAGSAVVRSAVSRLSRLVHVVAPFVDHWLRASRWASLFFTCLIVYHRDTISRSQGCHCEGSRCFYLCISANNCLAVVRCLVPFVYLMCMPGVVSVSGEEYYIKGLLLLILLYSRGCGCLRQACGCL